MSSRTFVLGLVLALTLGVAAGAWWLVQAPPASPAPPESRVATPAQAPESSPPPAADRHVELVEPVAEANAPTTVVFPVKIDLELLASAVRPQGEGAGAMGADATARLVGSVHGAGGEPLPAQVLFVAGPNAGRRIDATRDGGFGANDLYPGLSVVKISAAGTPGSLREVLLRKGRETQLNLGYGRPGLVQGLVKNAVDEPIADARVTIDGQEGRTDETGAFVLPAVAAGDTFAVVEKPGFAARMEKLTVVAGQAIEKGKLVYVLAPAARLEITIEDRINVDNEALVFILPQSMDATRDFPWYRVNPVPIHPGGTKVIEDLPARAVTLRLFHAGAAAAPALRAITLREQGTEHVDLHLVPAPVVNGTVTEDGKPVAGADVVLEAPERSMAMLAVLGEASYLDLEREVLPEFPPAVQHAKTNSAGEYVLDACENVSRTRYLHATSPDGKSTAWKLLVGGEVKVDLALERSHGDGQLILRMAGRTQGLPVEITVDGAPRDSQVLPPGRDLHIGGLAPGTWRFSARWNGEPLFDGMLIDVREEVSLDMTLPEGAIVGQDQDTRKRSGK